MSEVVEAKKPFRILCLDGGGIRGVITARILQEVEKQIQGHCQQPLADYFDMIAGTSTGSLLASSIALGYSSKELVELYAQRGLEIFPYQSLGSLARWKLVWKYGLSAPKFSNEGLVKVLSSMPGFQRNGEPVRLKEVGKVPGQDRPSPILLILAYDALHRNTTFFTNHHPALARRWYDTMPLWKICVASASAPTFFPACELTHEESGVADDGSGEAGHDVTEQWSFPHVDGGVTANNPALCAVAQAIKLGHRLEDIQLLSIGTGQNKKPLQHKEIEGWGLIEWGLRIADVFMEGQAELQGEVCQQLLGGFESHRYLRLQFDLNDSFGEPKNHLAQAPLLPASGRKNRWLSKYLSESMDDAKPDNIRDLLEATERYLDQGNLFEGRFEHYGSVENGIKDFIFQPEGKRVRQAKAALPAAIPPARKGGKPSRGKPGKADSARSLSNRPANTFFGRLAQDAERRGLGRTRKP